MALPSSPGDALASSHSDTLIPLLACKQDRSLPQLLYRNFKLLLKEKTSLLLGFGAVYKVIRKGRHTCLYKSEVLTPPGLWKLFMNASVLISDSSVWILSSPERPCRSASSRGHLSGIYVTSGRVTSVLEQHLKWCSKTLPSCEAGLVKLST